MVQNMPPPADKILNFFTGGKTMLSPLCGLEKKTHLFTWEYQLLTLALLVLIALQTLCRRLPQPVCSGRARHPQPARCVPGVVPQPRGHI